MAYIGSSPTKVVSRQSANIFTYTVSVANTTVFSGADDNGNTLACSPSDIMVHMNGIKLEESDYTASTTTVTLGSGAAAGDEVTITAFLTFESADHYTKSAADTRYVNASGDTMTGALTVSGSNGELLNVSSNTGSELAVYVDGNEISFRADADNNNNDSVMTFDLDGSERMRIDASGIVTKPNQPFIECYGSLGSAFAYTAGSVVTHWSDRTTPVGITRSGGRFTVPVSGKYYFGFVLYSYVNTSGHYRIFIAINGTNHSLTQIEVSSGAMIDSLFDHTIMYSNILNLSANDYVEIKVNDAQNIYRGSPHNSLSMMLIG